MVQYPVRVPREMYRGSNPARLRKVQERNRVAAVLEEHSNRKVEQSHEPVVNLLYGFIAHDLALSQSLVQSILIRVDGGHNGMMVRKSGTPE